MKAALTLEHRVTLWSALVVAVSLLVCGGGGAWFLHRQAVAQLDRQLQQVAAQFVFERFYRAEHEGRVPGHGLGLSIARELARAHEGSLELARADESETVFRLMLPVVPAGTGVMAGERSNAARQI